MTMIHLVVVWAELGMVVGELTMCKLDGLHTAGDSRRQRGDSRRQREFVSRSMFRAPRREAEDDRESRQ